MQDVQEPRKLEAVDVKASTEGALTEGASVAGGIRQCTTVKKRHWDLTHAFKLADPKSLLVPKPPSANPNLVTESEMAS